MSGIGVLGLGLALPPEVRDNRWWPDDLVATWKPPFSTQPPSFELSAAGRDIVAVMRSSAADPFQGVQRRHVLAPDASLLELEATAAHEALADAGLTREDIDVLLLYRAPVEHQLTNIACELHARLGLPRRCFSLQTEGAQHAFLLQLDLARALIASGQARRALLVQSSGISRVLDPKSSLSTAFGDGATATVVGAVSAGRGVLGTSHQTDGEHPNALVATTQGGRWYDAGASYLQIRDPVGMRDSLLKTVDVTCEGIFAACATAGVRPAEIDVFVMHQGMAWLRKLVQTHAGLANAQSLDTIADTGHLFGAFLPSTLVLAQRAAMLDDERLVLLAGGGTGMTFGAAVIRWGR